MPNGFGFRGGWGFGFRGSSPPWPYVGRGRGGLPRCWAYIDQPSPPPASMPYYYGEWGPPAYGGYQAPAAAPYDPQVAREQELNFLREEANAVKGQLDEIEARIKELEK